MNRRPPIAPMPEGLAAHLQALSPEQRQGLEEAWAFCEQARPNPAPAADRKAAQREALLRLTETAPRVRPRPALPFERLLHRLRPLLSGGLLRPVALASLVALVLVAVFYLNGRPTLYQAPRGEVLALTLSDGSSVTLNSGSTLRVDAHFGDDARRVALDGEAFFSVAHDGTPFTVETFDAVTEVLGTRFNVRARPHDLDQATQVAVEEGRVRLRSRVHPQEQLVLTAGQAAGLSEDGRLSPVDTTLDHYLAWRTGELFFEDQPLGLIFDELERRFDVEIQAPEAVRLRHQSYFRHPPFEVETVLADLTQMAGLRYRPTAHGFEVYLP